MGNPVYSRKLVRIANRLRRITDKLILASVNGDERSVFFDVEKTYPSLLKIDENFAVIRDELETVLPKTEQIPRYHEVDVFQTELSGNDDRDWRVLYICLPRAGDGIPNRDLCPRTAKILDGIPNLVGAFFSILDSKKSVPSHEGPSPHKLRYHTAFKVPKENPPTLRVKDRYHTWEEGKSLLFDDSWEHEVTNESDDSRVVLIIDVERPVALHLRLLNRLIARLYAAGIKRDDWLPFYKKISLQKQDNAAQGDQEDPR